MRIRRIVVGELQTNCYIVADSDGEAAIIDPGADAERIEQFVVSHDLTPRCILCTHGHWDHTYGAARLQATFNIDLLAHESDWPTIEAGPDELARALDLPAYQRPAIGPAIADEQVISVGALRLQVIHTPGHTPGGVSFLCDRDVFTGDTLFACGIGRTDMLGGSAIELMRSIETRLLIMDDDTRVHPGHGDETTIGEEKRENPWLRKPESED